MWKKSLAMAAAIGLVLAGAGIVRAGTTTGRTPVNCMDTTWQTSSFSTSSTGWTNVPGFEADPTAIYPITVGVGATIFGAPVRLRILSTNVGEQTVVGSPGPTGSTRAWAARARSRTSGSTATRRPRRTPASSNCNGGARPVAPSGCSEAT